MPASLDPGAGQTRRAYLFAYRRPGAQPIVIFDYCASRAGKHAAAFLDGWQGALMVDDYSGYKALFAAGVTELACWAHARRTFVDAHKASGSPLAREAIERIGELYAIEAKLRDLDDATRLRERQNHLAPRLDRMRVQEVAMGGGYLALGTVPPREGPLWSGPIDRDDDRDADGRADGTRG